MIHNSLLFCQRFITLFGQQNCIRKRARPKAMRLQHLCITFPKWGLGKAQMGSQEISHSYGMSPNALSLVLNFCFSFVFFCVFLTNWFVLDQKKNKQTGLWCNREGLGFCHDGFESSICFQLVKNPLPFVSLLSLKSSCMKKKGDCVEVSNKRV